MCCIVECINAIIVCYYVSVHHVVVYIIEIRNVGIGYYAFDTDEQKREEQIKMLNKLRENVSFLYQMLC